MKPKIFEQNCILFYDYWINSINYSKSMLYFIKCYENRNLFFWSSLDNILFWKFTLYWCDYYLEKIYFYELSTIKTIQTQITEFQLVLPS